MRLPRWFPILLAVDAVLVVLAAALGARLLLDAAPQAGRIVDWGRQRVTSPAVPLAPPGPSSPPPATMPAGGARLGPELLRRLDSDAAASANAQRGLLGLVEEALRRRVVEVLEGIERNGATAR